MENFDLMIVGNGFDLANDLHTSYSDFYNTMKNAYLSLRAGDFVRNIGSYFKININEQMLNRGLITFHTFVQNNKENFFVKYFINYQTIFDTWNALEMELKDLLIAIDYMFDNINNKTSQGSGLFEISDIINHGQYDVYMKSLVGNWKNISFNADADFSKGWITIKGITNYSVPVLNKWLSDFKEKAIDELFEEFKSFTHLFATFLNVFGRPEFVTYDQNIKVKKIISYNYTSVAQKKYSLSDENVFYIHGKFQPADYTDKVLLDDIIFGIDDTLFKNESLVKFLKSDQRHMLKEKKKIYAFVKDVESICVYGHSFDLLDKDTLKMILSDAKNITIFCYNSKAQTIITQNLKKILVGKNIEEEIERENIIFRSCSEVPFLKYK